MSACLKALIDRGLDVAQVIERIEDADDVHAVFHALAHEAAHRIIRIMMVAEQILPAQQHLQLGMLHMRFDLAQALPRVFVQIAQAAVEGRAAPAFDRMIAGLVHLVEDSLEIVKRHTGCDQRLLRIAQYGFGDMHLFHEYAPPLAAKRDIQAKLTYYPILLNCIIARSFPTCNVFILTKFFPGFWSVFLCLPD